MTSSRDQTFDSIRSAIASHSDRVSRAQRIAQAISSGANCRWVGIYDVTTEEVSIIAWAGLSAPAYSRFPVAQGLTGSAISSKNTVVVGDVTKDPRYLTAFGSTLSEIIIPVIHATTGQVIGTIDVESEEANAFTEQDRVFFEKCAAEARAFWEDADEDQ